MLALRFRSRGGGWRGGKFPAPPHQRGGVEKGPFRSRGALERSLHFKGKPQTSAAPAKSESASSATGVQTDCAGEFSTRSTSSKVLEGREGGAKRSADFAFQEAGKDAAATAGSETCGRKKLRRTQGDACLSQAASVAAASESRSSRRTDEEPFRKEALLSLLHSKASSTGQGNRALKARLKGSRFRALNEFLYVNSGQRALEEYKHNPRLFEAVRTRRVLVGRGTRRRKTKNSLLWGVRTVSGFCCV